MGLNYQLGRLLEKYGFKLVRDFRYPASNLNLLHLGLSHVFSLVEDPVIVQIGAFDGHHADPLRIAIAQHDCRVLLVEPQAAPFRALRERYAQRPNTLLENSAIAASDGEMTMFLPKADASSPKASLDPEHMSRFGLGASEVGQITVKTLSAPSLLKKHGLGTVNVLLIDTEGHDYKVLSQFFAGDIEPEVINLEVLHLGREERLALRRDLDARGYLYQDYAYDTFAIKKSLMA